MRRTCDDANAFRSEPLQYGNRLLEKKRRADLNAEVAQDVCRMELAAVEEHTIGEGDAGAGVKSIRAARAIG